MFPAQKNDRKRYTLQWEKMQYLSKAIRNWRNMSTATKNAWNLFAATFPQPTETDPNQYLSGYQLFIKRNYYRFLHEGIEFDFLYEPELSELPVPNFEAHIADDGMCIDVTEEYIRNHGILPKVGQFIICRIIPMATDSGQFFAPLIATLEVQEVYIDGLITSFHFSPIPEKIVFSLYMSRPVYQSNQYAGTKFRYMGCFKPTKFIQLTDTPDSYEAQAGKIVAVKDDETGLEFIDAAGCEVCPPVPGPADAGKVIVVNPAGDGYELAEGGGGGLSCEDLLDCGIIQQILNDIENLQTTIISAGDTSIPPIKYGLLYNYLIFEGTKTIIQPGWRLFTQSDWIQFTADIGGMYTAGGHLKVAGTEFWNSPNTDAVNSILFNCMPNGWRSDTTGSDGWLKRESSFWTNFYSHATHQTMIRCRYDSNASSNVFIPKIRGAGVRLIRDAVGLPNGSKGSYTGFNGRIYRTIVHNEIEVMADNLAETLFSDGSEIPYVPMGTNWPLLTSGAYGIYNNDEENI
jgi:uncharacterized protein (TIGR02145 family)